MQDPVPVTLTQISAAVGGSNTLTGHLVRPDGPGPWPGGVVVHEMFGVNEVMLRQARRLASAGFLTLMPNLYTDGGALRCLVPTMRAALSGQGRAYGDIAAARSRLVDDPACTGRVGIIGFCMGGTFALMAAGSGVYDVASANYGQLPKNMGKVLADACPVVASYGGRDRRLKGAAAKLESVLDRLGVVRDVKEYPRAGHAFLNDEQFGPRLVHPLLRVVGVGPEPVASADAWQRIEAFFHTHLQQTAEA